jgi:DNA-binding MarR family transcriptional regulator
MTQPFPDDELRRLLRWLVRAGELLEPHDHDGVRASASEVFALGELTDAGALSQQQLGERLGLEKSTVSRLAAGLERRGWLERVRDPANRRYYQLALTPTGVTAAERIGAYFTEQHQHLFAALTAEERAGLLVGMSGLARVMEHHEHHHHEHHEHHEHHGQD